LSAKRTAQQRSRLFPQASRAREHASTFLVPVQHHTGTSQCGCSLAIPLRVSDEWHRTKTSLTHLRIMTKIHSNNGTERLKTAVRRLPPNLPEDVFWQSVQAWVTEETVTWKMYVSGKAEETVCVRHSLLLVSPCDVLIEGITA